MTRGPIDPPITGSSVDFPVSLSVSVTVPVIMLLPSIDPPLSLSLLAVAGFSAKIGLLRALGKRTHQVVDPAQALVPPQGLHHDKNPRGGEGPGQSGAQRLSGRAELYSFLIGKRADLVFEPLRLPLGAVQPLE